MLPRIIAALCAGLVMLVLTSAAILHTFNQNHIYESSGLLELLGSEPKVYVGYDDLLNQEPAATEPEVGTTDEDNRREQKYIHSQSEILRSQSITLAVENRLQGTLRDRFMAPYVNGAANTQPRTPIELLESNRFVEPIRISRMIRVRYRHPDPVVAAQVANLFMQEFINFQLKTEIDAYMRIVEDLSARVAAAQERINQANVDYVSQLKKGSDSKAATIQAKRALEDEIDFHSSLTTAIREAKFRVNMANPHARIVDNAIPSSHPHSPNVPVQLSGRIGGAFLISIVVYLLAQRMLRAVMRALARRPDHVA